MLSESIRRQIRQRLIHRLAPRVYAVDVWNGAGDGRPCDGCGEPVAADADAVEAVASRWLSVYFHAECYDLWNVERRLSPRDEAEAGVV